MEADLKFKAGLHGVVGWCAREAELKFKAGLHELERF